MSDWQYLAPYLPDLLQGLWLTAQTSVLAFLIAMAIGLLGAAARQSRIWPLRFVAGVYVEVVRNTPSLLQIFLIYFGLPSLAVHLSSFQAGVIALAVSGGAYLVEILRAGLIAVPASQIEAATTLGLSRMDTFRKVALPQALRYVYPPVVGQFVQMILGSSLLSVIGLSELTGQAGVVNSKTLLTMQVFGLTLIMYLILSNVISLLADVVGRHAFKPALTVRRDDRRLLRELGGRLTQFVVPKAAQK